MAGAATSCWCAILSRRRNSPPSSWMKIACRFASEELIMKTTLATALLLGLAVSSAGLHGDSLWTKSSHGETGLTADRKAGRTGDILTIIVAESATAQNSQQRKDSRTSALQDAVGQFLFSAAASKFGTHNGELPALNLAGSSSFNGGGQVNNS